MGRRPPGMVPDTVKVAGVALMLTNREYAAGACGGLRHYLYAGSAAKRVPRGVNEPPSLSMSSLFVVHGYHA
jgi:hypothetical protein